ncbi:MAG: phosphoribosylanthranilate isomerase [Myxococcota bacterium]|nr:phosphoribosylanthranilate isomerase [Myxococcota bacterium]
MVKIKICGIRDAQGARACAEAKVEFVGFNFVPGRRRQVTPEQAQALHTFCPDSSAVGVFMNQSFEVIQATNAVCPLDYIQLHGDETPELCREVATLAPVIKAFAVTENFKHESLAGYANFVEFWLFDGAKAGEGERFAWAKLSAPSLTKPFFVAGGINQTNVSKAISEFSPYGVDTASGIEIDGKQDRGRILDFCETIRGNP